MTDTPEAIPANVVADLLTAITTALDFTPGTPHVELVERAALVRSVTRSLAADATRANLARWLEFQTNYIRDHIELLGVTQGTQAVTD